jgi:hypothetical protein
MTGKMKKTAAFIVSALIAFSPLAAFAYSDTSASCDPRGDPAVHSIDYTSAGTQTLREDEGSVFACDTFFSGLSSGDLFTITGSSGNNGIYEFLGKSAYNISINQFPADDRASGSFPVRIIGDTPIIYKGVYTPPAPAHIPSLLLTASTTGSTFVGGVARVFSDNATGLMIFGGSIGGLLIGFWLVEKFLTSLKVASDKDKDIDSLAKNEIAETKRLLKK